MNKEKSTLEFFNKVRENTNLYGETIHRTNNYEILAYLESIGVSPKDSKYRIIVTDLLENEEILNVIISRSRLDFLYDVIEACYKNCIINEFLKS